MKFTGEVFTKENTGDGCQITIGNINRVGQAFWRTGMGILKICVPLSFDKLFLLGRRVKIDVSLEKKS